VFVFRNRSSCGLLLVWFLPALLFTRFIKFLYLIYQRSYILRYLTFLQEPCWQGWLLAALAASLKRSKSTLGDIAEESVWLLGPEEALMRKLFRAFHVYCICTSRNGWLHVERTCNFVHLLAKEVRLD
jgi:hypothetical protein